MKRFALAVLIISGIAKAQIAAPQIALTGNIGTGGAFSLFNGGQLQLSSDANYVLNYPQISAIVINVTSSVPLTGTRALTVPAGYNTYFVENNTTGSQNITFGASTGSVVTIPNGSWAIVLGDGTNYGSISSGSGSGTVTNCTSGTTNPFAYYTATTVANCATGIRYSGAGQMIINNTTGGNALAISTQGATGLLQVGTAVSGNTGFFEVNDDSSTDILDYASSIALDVSGDYAGAAPIFRASTAGTNVHIFTIAPALTDILQGSLKIDSLIGHDGCLTVTSGTVGSAACGGSTAFSAITSGTNSTATMIVGTSGSITPQGGTGAVVMANNIGDTSQSVAMMTGAPSAGNVLTAINATTMHWAAPVSTSGPNKVVSAYNALGDSIPCGYVSVGHTAPFTRGEDCQIANGYPFVIAGQTGIYLQNEGVPGDYACDLWHDQISANTFNPTGGNSTITTLGVGTNDAIIKGTGAYETNFNACQQAVLAWTAIPAGYKAFPAAATLGSGWTLTSSPTLGAYIINTSGSGTATFPLTTNGGAIYFWYVIEDSGPGVTSYNIDGGSSLGTFNTISSTPISTQNGNTTSVALGRITGIAAGVHTVGFTLTSGAVAIMGVGTVPPSTYQQFPYVIVGQIPLPMTGSESAPTLAAMVQYDTDAQANVTLLSGDGLKVQYSPNHSFLTGASNQYTDALHTTPLGAAALASAFLVNINAIPFTITAPISSTPFTSGSFCLPGQTTQDALFFYVCTANNVWRSVGLPGGIPGTSFGTAGFVNTGTSGATVPLLNGANTWSATQAFAGVTSTSFTDTALSTAGIVTNTSGGLLGTTATVPVANGGTGAATLTSGSALIGAGTSAVTFKALAGTGTGLTTGPTTSVSTDLADFTGTAGQVADSGVLLANVAVKNSAQTFSSTVTATQLIQSQGENVVTFSTTPAFLPTYQSNIITLTASLTSWTMAAGSAGQRETLTFCQNATGSFTTGTTPTNVRGFFTIGSTASKCSSQEFVYSANQTAWLATSTGTINQ